MAGQTPWIDVLKDKKETFEAVLGESRPFDAWWTATLTWCQEHPVSNIRSKAAFVDAYMDAARRGLMIDGKECIIQVRGRAKPRIKCEVGYRGVIKQAGDAGILMDPHVIYEGDEISLDEGEGKVSHRPAWIVGADPGEVRGFYCVCSYEKTGTQRIFTMSKAEAQKRSTDTDSWKKWPEEMGKKSVLLRAGKALHFTNDAEDMGFIASKFADPTGEEDPPASSSARDHVLAEAERQQQDADAEAPQEEEWNGPPEDGDSF